MQAKWILIKYSKHFSVVQACSGWVTWVEEWEVWVAVEWAAIVQAVLTFSSAKITSMQPFLRYSINLCIQISKSPLLAVRHQHLWSYLSVGKIFFSKVDACGCKKKHLPVICAVHTLSQSLRLSTETSYHAIHGLRFIIFLCFFWLVID